MSEWWRLRLCRASHRALPFTAWAPLIKLFKTCASVTQENNGISQGWHDDKCNNTQRMLGAELCMQQAITKCSLGAGWLGTQVYSLTGLPWDSKLMALTPKPANSGSTTAQHFIAPAPASSTTQIRVHSISMAITCSTKGTVNIYYFSHISDYLGLII